MAYNVIFGSIRCSEAKFKKKKMQPPTHSKGQFGKYKAYNNLAMPISTAFF